MWFRLVLSVAVFLLVQVADAQQTNLTCGSDWKEFNGHCYWFSTPDHGKFLANETEKLCNFLKSKVVSIHSPEENKFILDNLKAFSTSIELFIGYRCQDDDGYWTDGSLVDYKNVLGDNCKYSPTVFYLRRYDGSWLPTTKADSFLVSCKRPKPV